MPNYAKLQAYLPGGFSKPIPKAGTIIWAETPPLKTKNWKYNPHTMNKFARKNRYLASSTYGDKPSVPNAPSASINGSSLRGIAPAQTHSSHPWVDWRRSWKTEKGKQNSISPCDNIQQNALCLSTWSWQMAHSGPPMRSRSLSREGSWHWWLKNFTMTHSGLIANFCEKKSKKRVSQRRPRSAMLLLPQRGQRAQDDYDCHSPNILHFGLNDWLIGWDHAAFLLSFTWKIGKPYGHVGMPSMTEPDKFHSSIAAKFCAIRNTWIWFVS